MVVEHCRRLNDAGIGGEEIIDLWMVRGGVGGDLRHDSACARPGSAVELALRTGYMYVESFHKELARLTEFILGSLPPLRCI